jgi:hypothetical protein
MVQATGLEALRYMVAGGSCYTLLLRLAVGGELPLQELIQYKPLRD